MRSPSFKKRKIASLSLPVAALTRVFTVRENQEKLRDLLDRVVLPRKGKLSAINKEIENSEDFREVRRKHSAVESSINALENHGLDRCRDHGIKGFKRYVGLAVLARNIQIIGHVLQQKKLKQVQRLEKMQKRRLKSGRVVSIFNSCFTSHGRVCPILINSAH